MYSTKTAEPIEMPLRELTHVLHGSRFPQEAAILGVSAAKGIIRSSISAANSALQAEDFYTFLVATCQTNGLYKCTF